MKDYNYGIDNTEIDELNERIKYLENQLEEQKIIIQGPKIEN